MIFSPPSPSVGLLGLLLLLALQFLLLLELLLRQGFVQLVAKESCNAERRETVSKVTLIHYAIKGTETEYGDQEKDHCRHYGTGVGLCEMGVLHYSLLDSANRLLELVLHLGEKHMPIRFGQGLQLALHLADPLDEILGELAAGPSFGHDRLHGLFQLLNNPELVTGTRPTHVLGCSEKGLSGVSTTARHGSLANTALWIPLYLCLRWILRLPLVILSKIERF